MICAILFWSKWSWVFKLRLPVLLIKRKRGAAFNSSHLSVRILRSLKIKVDAKEYLHLITWFPEEKGIWLSSLKEGFCSFWSFRFYHKTFMYLSTEAQVTFGTIRETGYSEEIVENALQLTALWRSTREIKISRLFTHVQRCSIFLLLNSWWFRWRLLREMIVESIEVHGTERRRSVSTPPRK